MDYVLVIRDIRKVCRVLKNTRIDILVHQYKEPGKKDMYGLIVRASDVAQGYKCKYSRSIYSSSNEAEVLGAKKVFYDTASKTFKNIKVHEEYEVVGG